MLNSPKSVLQSASVPSGDDTPTNRVFDAHKTSSLKLVLNAGSGPYAAHKLHPVFQQENWEEIRVDIDPKSKPDIVASITDMKLALPAQRFDAVWSSHTLEHLYSHEVPLALSEFRRVLNPKGFVLVTLPDLKAVASLIVDRGLDHVAYVSEAGPITPMDMLFGHVASVTGGFLYMAHKTGFTSATLGHNLIEAGFPTVVVKREGLNLWALGLMQEADRSIIEDELHLAGLDLSE